MKGKRVEIKQTGERGTVIKVMNNCLWVKMDDGTEHSGAKRYWKLLPSVKSAAKPRPVI